VPEALDVTLSQTEGAENKELRRIFGPKREEANCVMRKFIICDLPQILLR
jgi:hypothetical protein